MGLQFFERRNLKTVRLLLFGFLFLTAPLLWAQGEECATVLTPEQIQFELERYPTGWVYPDVSAAPSECIALTIHIVRKSDGSGGLTLAELENAMNDLNAQYQNVPMRFFQNGSVDYIDDDNYYLNTNNGSMWNALRQVNSVANTVNVYFVPNTGICGISAFTTSSVQGMIVDNACAGNTPPLRTRWDIFLTCITPMKHSLGLNVRTEATAPPPGTVFATRPPTRCCRIT